MLVGYRTAVVSPSSGPSIPLGICAQPLDSFILNGDRTMSRVSLPTTTAFAPEACVAVVADG